LSAGDRGSQRKAAPDLVSGAAYGVRGMSAARASGGRTAAITGCSARRYETEISAAQDRLKQLLDLTHFVAQLGDNGATALRLKPG
jgi:hypothetical protein